MNPCKNKTIIELLSLNELYEKAGYKDKQELISSKNSKNSFEDGSQQRTSQLNESVEPVYKCGEGFNEKKWTNRVKFRLVHFGAHERNNTIRLKSY